MGWYYNTWGRAPKVSGGIKAQSKRGSFGSNWWAERWIETLMEYDMDERLTRGKSYARRGQVTELKIGKGRVTAVIQGSSEYDVVINIKVLGKSKWRDIVKRIMGRPTVAASLLSGRMHEGIESIFADAKVMMFASKSDTETYCTCPDWANPCKHIAAVYFLLAEEFDRDPLLIFQMRGIERGELLEMAGLGTRMQKGATGKKGGSKKREDKTGANTKSSRTAPLSADPLKFWSRGDSEYDPGRNTVPSISAPIVKQLGNFPLWRGEDKFLPTMEGIYEGASEVGAMISSGIPPEDQTELK